MDFPPWLRSRGGRIHPELDLFHTLPSGDRGVIARSDIAEGELLLLLPIDCAIYIPTDEEFKKHPNDFPDAVRYLREAHPGLSPFLATTLVLMSEMTRGSVSPWAAYVATLPASCPDCLLNWTEEEKLELKGTSLEQSGPDPAVDVYRRHVAPILACRTDLWPGLAAKEPPAAEATGATLDAGLAAFARAAGLVQSRAFHLEAENWVSGAKEIAHLENGGTQVFLLPGIDMINHSHNPDRRNAHLERLNVAQAAAAKLLEREPGEEDAREGAKGVGVRGVEAFFVMRADKPIKAGEEVLHTYGNLSDAQLLQTYGFLDSEDDFFPAQFATSVGPSPKKRANAGGNQTAAAAGASGDGGGGDGYRNPYNAALVPWTAVEEVCVGLLKSMDQALPAALRRSKRDFLAAAGVLQSAAPEATQFVLLAQEPLPDELMTAVQVLLMTKDEFQELRREFGSSDPKSTPGGRPAPGAARKAAGKGAKAGGKAAATSAAPAAPGDSDNTPSQPHKKLSLGTALLEEDEDFAEMVCIASLQILESCMERYPSSVKDDVRLLRSAECRGRQRLAVRVRLGEKDVLQTAKKAVVELMKRLRDGGAAEGSQDDDDDDDDNGEEEEVESEDEKEEDGQRRAPKRQRRGLGAPPSEGEDADKEVGSGGRGGNGDDGGDDDEDDEDEAADGLLMGSDDSDKVGYGAVDYDDGIGEAHDRGKAHDLPKDN
ncbi:hypothetical protein VOLCADRAFT_118106 [Volvox carteri f. nagariensis]|uniref:SET domain-containing protein n=1 Tax=Volvox carteri f. nagariensis TaxID=3068 RepID=D8U1T7_VOLCA|nr:uncharacterized protein VOLCADRAFT_118106 [Volvox carteri f. nagariensis]EFJ46170.1 hypothetical protein VOLCADRAFT_118106 [Volvox carteri f. nagariensis]|eukprot:XP_002952617.1 hypothetical protein VOLCADRAFT_118106 [Volvox carteri f. nagariensis]